MALMMSLPTHDLCGRRAMINPSPVSKGAELSLGIPVHKVLMLAADMLHDALRANFLAWNA